VRVLHAALQVAAGHPLARSGQVEVRPFWDGPWDHWSRSMRGCAITTGT